MSNKRQSKRRQNNFEKGNIEQIKPTVNSQIISQIDIKQEQKLQIPDRSLQFNQQQINLQVLNGDVIDGNINPELMRAYVQPPRSHTRKITFIITNLVVLLSYIGLMNWNPSNQQQEFTKEDKIGKIKIYYIISSITIVINLIFYFLIKPERIMKYADHFLLLNIHQRNMCLNIVIGYLISDFGVIMTPIALIFLCINSAQIGMQYLQERKRSKADKQRISLIPSQKENRYSQINSTQSGEIKTTGQVQMK